MIATLYAERLRELRRDRLMTRRAVARKIGARRALVGQYDRGEAMCPVEPRKALAGLFGVTPAYLMGWTVGGDR